MFILSLNQPHFVDCGKLVSELPFLHAYRKNLEYQLLLGMRGTLHICVGEQTYKLEPGDIILNPPNIPLYGTEPSGHLSYFWCHFQLPEKGRMLSAEHASTEYNRLLHSAENEASTILIPDSFHLTNASQAIIFSQQLLNFHCSPEYPSSMLDHLTACLLTELSVQAAKLYFAQEAVGRPRRFQEIIQWIRVNAHRKLTVSEIAHTFGYNPDYLSCLFRQKLGVPLKHYLIQVKLEIVKELLISSDRSIKEISAYVGFDDEKYLMRLFRQNEGLTPSQFRNAYSQTKFNTNFRVSKRLDTRWISFLEDE